MPPIPSVLFPGNSVGKLLETQLGLVVHHFRACFLVDPFFFDEMNITMESRWGLDCNLAAQSSNILQFDTLP